MKLYSKKYVLLALKKAKLPHNYRTLIRYERLGVIKRPDAIMQGSKDRYYTEEDINEIVGQVRKWKEKL